jgi:hypothetical protein
LVLLIVTFILNLHGISPLLDLDKFVFFQVRMRLDFRRVEALGAREVTFQAIGLNCLWY